MNKIIKNKLLVTTALFGIALFMNISYHEVRAQSEFQFWDDPFVDTSSNDTPNNVNSDSVNNNNDSAWDNPFGDTWSTGPIESGNSEPSSNSEEFGSWDNPTYPASTSGNDRNPTYNASTSGNNPSTESGGTFALKNPLNVNSVGELVQNLVEIFSYVAILFAVIVFIYIGFSYVLASAQGNATKIKELHSWLMWAIVGVAIVIGARVIVEIIIATLGMSGSISPEVMNSTTNVLRR